MKNICVLLSLLILTQPVFSAFKDPGWGVRPLGMGGAFTAIANDSNANIFNPAGIAYPEYHEVSFMSSKLFTGLEGVDVGQNYLSYIYRYNDVVGNFGFAWTSLYAQNLYKEDTFVLSYGRIFTDALWDWFEIGTFDLLGGANLKYLNHEFTLDERSKIDPVFEGGNSKGAAAVDLGFMVMPFDSGYTFGLALKNINSPDVGLKTVDEVPMETAVGVSYYSALMPYLKLPECTIDIDLVSRDKAFEYRLGIETWILKGNLCIRSGFNPQEVAFGLGHELFLKGDTRMEIDYAFSLPLEIEETTGSHRLGITLRFP